MTSGYITANGNTITAKLSDGQVLSGSFDGVVKALRFLKIDAHEVTMPDKCTADSLTAGQRIALYRALKKGGLIGLHARVDRANFASAEELVNVVSQDALNAWASDNFIFSIDHDGATLYPLYALWESRGILLPRPSMPLIIAALQMDPWHMTWWFGDGCSMLNGRRPQDMLEADPEAVLAAAIDEARAGGKRGRRHCLDGVPIDHVSQHD